MTYNCARLKLRRLTNKHNIRNEDGSRPYFHQLRHSFASRYVDKVSSNLLMDLLGHNDFRTTQGYISRYSNQDKKAFLEASKLT